MPHAPYDYSTRRGILPVSWEDVHGLCKALALIMAPWDREVLVDGRFVFHPEYVEALSEQGIPADPSLLIPATPFKVAKAYNQ